MVEIVRKGMQVRNAEGVRAKFGVDPALIPDAPLFVDVDEIEWRGPTEAFSESPQRMDDKRKARVEKAVAARSTT